MALSFSQLAAGALVALLPFAADAAKPARPRDFTLLFVGGSGGDATSPTLTRLEARLRELPPRGTLVVFTGNYSANELPIAGDPGRAEAERSVQAHVTATRDFVGRGGKVYFLVGHRDFADGGTRAVRRLRKFLNRAFEAALPDDADVDVMPAPGCGTHRLLELTPNLGVVLVNSQWWMQDGLADPELNEGCETKTRVAFEGHLIDLFRDYRNKRLIVASHHPLRSYGPHGGAFTAAAHLSPAPVLGTAWVLARQAGLVAQHQNHPKVHAYVDFVLNEAERNGAYVFASGHDESLQYLRLGRQTQLISGTSARAADPTVTARPGDFASATPGWVELAIAASGAGTARFIAADATPIFQTLLPDLGSLGPPRAEPPAALPTGPVAASWSTKPVWQFPWALKLLAGTYYSHAFALRLPYDVLDLATEQGGLTPYKIGGGGQTNSIRARDRNGGDWAIRSTTKDSSRLLPYPINQISIVGRLLDHGFTATHPEGALAMPRLAQALGLLHLRPRLMFLPDQEPLGAYRGFITDEVVMLEQRPHALDEGVLPEHLGGAARFKQYEEVVDKLLSKPAKHRVDQEALLRARLLDVLVADWDRHRGQWRFAATTGADGVHTYTPIPLDRDQAFSSYDGLGLMVARLIVAQSRSLQPFTGEYGRLGWLNYNARDFDALMLNRLTRERWMAIAAEVQGAISDAVIDEAFSTWHRETFALDGERLAAALKTRRDHLPEAAAEFFALVNQNVDVVGSERADRFELSFEPTGSVRVLVRGAGAPWYDRTFQPNETRELRLYALEGDDVLVVQGTPHTKIDVRFVGGEGKDRVEAAGDRHLEARALRLYDSENGAQISPSISLRDERSSVAALNQYEQRENHEPDFGTFMPSLYVNSDDGVALGGTYTHVFQGFKKSPFGSRHDLKVHFATATLGAAVDYRALFPQSADLLDQQLELSLQTPTHTRNFFGLTNQLVDAGEAADYYRVRQALYEARYGLSFGFGGDRSRVGAQLIAQAIVTEPTPGRFVATSPDVRRDALGARYFGGARLFAETNTFDSLTLPRQGVAAHASVDARYDLARGNQLSTRYKLAAAAAIPLDRQQRFVVLTRASLEGIIGEHPFYFAPTLGDPQLRAYQQQQLAGEAAFVHSTDLRIDVVRIAKVLPGTIGVNLSADHGRVFGASIRGDDYHLSLGGGVWWSVVDLIGVSLAYHRGLDGGSRFTVAVGPLFSNTGF